MENKCYAAIDIGSNAVRLLIKKVDSCEDLMRRRMNKVLLLRVPLRLGFDVFIHGKVSDERAEKLLRLMKSFRQLMKIYEVDEYRACATSAMRDSSNGKEIIKKIKKSTGINIEIIDGQEEARLIYGNHIECQPEGKGNWIYVDVGGGSTEINLMVNNKLTYSFSYNIGTVRMLKGAVKKSSWRLMKDDLEKLTAKYGKINIIGSGGNINRLYRMATKKDKKKKRMAVESLKMLYENLKPLSPLQRMERYSLKEDRADVIVPAAEIFLFVSEITGAKYIHVPEVGLADGIIDNLYAKDLS
ncbi:MAG: Ppx/GppA family phosphatase [Prevotella sp.]|nr:Ppx/GppA family phosphatase [Prevotella sp.]